MGGNTVYKEVEDGGEKGKMFTLYNSKEEVIDFPMFTETFSFKGRRFYPPSSPRYTCNAPRLSHRP